MRVLHSATDRLYLAVLLHPERPAGVSLTGVFTSDDQAFLSGETFQLVSAVFHPLRPDTTALLDVLQS